MKHPIFFLSGLILAVISGFSQNPIYRADTFPVIYNYIEEVDTNIMVSNIRHMQDYGTRDCLTPEAVEAQNWIKEQFEGYDLPVELQHFSLWGISDPSDNVIAVKTGSTEPDKYVVIGGHYDSYSNFPQAPGADDNASGTSGVLEVARILSQFEFNRTIIFCAFSAEEYGLVGSEAYVSRCEQEGMNILGYFNMDMISYLKPGDALHSDMIAPPSALDLVNFYIDVASIYVPDLAIEEGVLSGGDSDHTSFNNHGYMGIFPFEDAVDHSPYIHTPADTIGSSVNSMLLAGALTEAALAAVATLAIPYDPVGIHGTKSDVSHVSLYPNPANNSINLQVEASTHSHFTIYTMHGSKVMEGEINRQSVLDISALSPGSYVLKVMGDRFIETKKLIVE